LRHFNLPDIISRKPDLNLLRQKGMTMLMTAINKSFRADLSHSFRSMNKLMLTLTGCLLAGCALATRDTPAPATGTLSALPSQPAIHVIIIFAHQAAEESKQLTAAIAYACRCNPVFFRKYSNNALIYEVNLPQNQAFPAFEKSLLASGASLGIKAVEQDILLQQQ
jgi:hypothetical protein